MRSSSALRYAILVCCAATVLLGCRGKTHEATTEPTASAETPSTETSSVRLSAPVVHSPDIRLTSLQVPAGRVTCGTGSCDARTSYCEVVQSDVLELPSDFSCRPLPSSCEGSRDCSCFPRGTRCSDFCSRTGEESEGGFRLTCVGGR